MAEQPTRFELSWFVPAGCPEQEAIVRDVDALTAASAKSQSGLQLRATGRIVSFEDGFALTLTLSDSTGSRSRTLEAPACEELGRAAALIVALSIDPSILERRRDPNDAKVVALWADALKVSDRDLVPTQCATSTQSPPKPPLTVVAPPTNQTLESSTVALPYRLGFGLLIGFGVLPHASFGGAINAAFQHKSLRIESTASGLAAKAKASNNGEGANFELYRLVPRVCWLVADTAWSVGPCAGIEVGVIVGEGFGVPLGRRKAALWWASSVGGTFEWRAASSSFVGVSADLGIPLRRDRFELAREELFRPTISGSVLLSLSAGWR